MKSNFLLILCIIFVSCRNNNQNNNISDEYKLIKVQAMVREMDSLYKIHNGPDFFRVAKEYSNEFPELYAGWCSLGSYYLYFEKNDSLAEYYTRKAISIDPKGYSSLQNLGVIFNKRKQYDSADIYYQKSILYKPNYGVAYSNLAGNRYQMGDFENAVKYAEIAVQLDNDTLDQAELSVYYGKCNRKGKVDSMLKVLADEKFSRINKIRELVGDTN
jgi:tetratricopeptide (TPR) repeat protein